tara:strand:+ start:786 stop:923 length:138 start_codon:yes stop_codon:yes gene_type:complete
MLYQFNFFWKLVTTLLFSWGLYFLAGFELSVVTLLALLIIFQNNN